MADPFLQPAIYPSFSLTPLENPLSDGGRWRSFATRPPLMASDDGTAIHGTVDFPVCGSVYVEQVFQGPVIEAWGCRPESGLGAALESHRIVALIGNPDAYNGYSWGFGGGIGEEYFMRKYTSGGFTGIGPPVSISSPRPSKMGIRLTPDAVEGWAYAFGAWQLIYASGDTSLRGLTFIALETEEQGGTAEVGWTCFGAGAPKRTQIYRYVSQ